MARRQLSSGSCQQLTVDLLLTRLRLSTILTATVPLTRPDTGRYHPAPDLTRDHIGIGQQLCLMLPAGRVRAGDEGVRQCRLEHVSSCAHLRVQSGAELACSSHSLGVLVPVTVGIVAGSVVAHASGSGGTVPIPTSSNVVTESSSTAPATGTNQWIFLPDPSLGTVPTLLSSGDMQMTNTGGNEDGYAYWNQPLAPSFLTASFDLSIGGGSGADGMTFSLADASSPGRGSYTCCGADLGFGGGTGLAVQFDTFQNTGCDPSANFVGVADYSATNNYGCTHIATASPLPVSLRQYPGQLFVQVLVEWVPSPSVTVWLNGSAVLTTTVPTPPTSVLPGFGGGTGGFGDNHDVSDIQIAYSS